MINNHRHRKPSDNHDPFRAWLKKYIQGNEQKWQGQHAFNEQVLAFMRETRDFMQETRDAFKNINVKLDLFIKIVRERLK